MGKMFERKYIALGRIVTHWKEIVGEDYAARSQPAKIHYFKAKNQKDKATASLDIAASSATCSEMLYRKDVILQTLETLFGDRWITDIKFVHIEPKLPSKPKKRTKILTEGEKNYLSQVLEEVDDPELKERLASLGQSILQEK